MARAIIVGSGVVGTATGAGLEEKGISSNLETDVMLASLGIFSDQLGCELVAVFDAAQRDFQFVVEWVRIIP